MHKQFPWNFSPRFHFGLRFLENHFQNSTLSSHIVVVFIVFMASFSARFVSLILYTSKMQRAVDVHFNDYILCY